MEKRQVLKRRGEKRRLKQGYRCKRGRLFKWIKNSKIQKDGIKQKRKKVNGEQNKEKWESKEGKNVGDGVEYKREQTF